MYVLTIPTYSHSGGTNSAGCHNDRVNGGYHCHNSNNSSSGSSGIGGYIVGFGGAIFLVSLIVGMFQGASEHKETTHKTYNQDQPEITKEHIADYHIYTGNDILIQIGVLGILISKIDGIILEKEKRLVYDWIKNQVHGSNREAKVSEIKKYVQYISTEDFTITKIKNEMNHYLRIIKTSCDLSFKYDILQLYIDIVIIDGVLNEKEKTSLYHIAKNIGITMDKFLDQFHNSLPNDLLEVAIDASTLGILPNMTDVEKKKILREQYRKWADLITSENEATRRKAEIMLKVISMERLKLKDTV